MLRPNPAGYHIGRSYRSLLPTLTWRRRQRRRETTVTMPPIRTRFMQSLVSMSDSSEFNVAFNGSGRWDRDCRDLWGH